MMISEKEKTLWRVYNRHPLGYTHKEKFKGDMIEIKAGDFLLMDYYEANEFRGQPTTMAFDGNGVQDPKSYKCIELVPDNKLISAEKVLERLIYVCHGCGKKMDGEEAYNAHMKAEHPEQLKKEDDIKEIIRRGK